MAQVLLPERHGREVSAQLPPANVAVLTAADLAERVLGRVLASKGWPAGAGPVVDADTEQTPPPGKISVGKGSDARLSAKNFDP
jgi:hypothetical protein